MPISRLITRYHAEVLHRKSIATPTNILLYHDPTDETNDRRSVDRKLPRSLFLITKRNREEFAWQFPQGKIRDTEDSLRKVKNTAFPFHYLFLCCCIKHQKRLMLSNSPSKLPHCTAHQSYFLLSSIWSSRLWNELLTELSAGIGGTLFLTLL